MCSYINKQKNIFVHKHTGITARDLSVIDSNRDTVARQNREQKKKNKRANVIDLSQNQDTEAASAEVRRA
jgi:hypothetical protein